MTYHIIQCNVRYNMLLHPIALHIQIYALMAAELCAMGFAPQAAEAALSAAGGDVGKAVAALLCYVMYKYNMILYMMFILYVHWAPEFI